MGLRCRLGIALAFTVGLSAATESIARASILERVVAVVGDRPILLSELKQRARPRLRPASANTSGPAQGAAIETAVFREVLDRLIDERLEELAAERARLTVTPEEIDRGIQQVAVQTRLTTRDVVAEALRQGLSEQEYRDEIRRRILEGKLIQLRVRGRVHVSEQEARAAYSRWQDEVGAQQLIDLRIIVFQIPSSASLAAANAVQALAQQVSQRAQSGTNFCTLFQQYNPQPGPTMVRSCGSRGPVPKSMLLPELALAAEGLEPGQTAAPIPFSDPLGNRAFLVVQRSPASPRVPAFDEVREQMLERATGDATDRQRKLWLQELRRSAYIDVRL